MNLWNICRLVAAHWPSMQRKNHRGHFNGSPWLLTLCLAIVSLGVTGCGSNFDLLLLRSAEATGRTFLDIFLTDLANSIAQPDENSPDDDGGTNTPTENGSNDGANGGGSLDGLVGDAANGQMIFVDNGCGGCHCDDASGGCALDAPPIVGVLIEVLDDHARGSADHPIKVDISDQELADLQAYLASL